MEILRSFCIFLFLIFQLLFFFPTLSLPYHLHFLSVSPTHIRAYACRHQFSIGEIVDNAKKDKRERKDVANKGVIEKGEKSAKKRERERLRAGEGGGREEGRGERKRDRMIKLR